MQKELNQETLKDLIQEIQSYFPKPLYISKIFYDEFFNYKYRLKPVRKVKGMKQRKLALYWRENCY